MSTTLPSEPVGSGSETASVTAVADADLVAVVASATAGLVAAAVEGRTTRQTTDRVPGPPASRPDSVFHRIDESGSDVEAARILGHRLYNGARFRPLTSRDGFAYRFASVGDRDVSLRLLTSTSEVVVDVDQLDDYVATWFRDGTTTITTHDLALDVAPGQPVVLPSTTSFTLAMQAGRQNLVQVDRTFLDRVAMERHGKNAQPIVFRADQMPDERKMVAWRDVMSTATPILIDPDSTSSMRAEANLLVARAMLTVFEWHTDLVPSAFQKPRLMRVRAAMDFLHDNAHRPITPTDAAAHAGITARSLQNAFQRHLDRSPTEYLRGVRLDRVRRDLIELTPDTATVTDLARAWGFGNQGRFATAYRARFGEKPNETLRR